VSAAAPTVHLDVADGVATIRIDNPTKRNCLDPPMWDLLFDAAAAAANDETVRVVVVRGAGDMAFSAGLDFDYITAGPDYLAAFETAATHMDRATEALSALEVPVIAGLRGVCMGGGVQIAMAADYRVAAADLRFGIPAAALGIMYPLTPIEKMTRIAGADAVKRLLIEGAEMDAGEALAAGFVEKILPVAEFDVRLAETAKGVALQPPEVVRAYKQMIDNFAAGAGSANPEIRDRALRSGVIDEKLAELGRRRRG
jgi:enoyl-CoA hydratase/carnithine racemase